MESEAQGRRPGGLTGWVVRRYTPPGESPSGPAARTALGERQGYVSMAVSVLLSSTKAVLGWISGSVSLLADAVNNLADVGSSLIVAFSFRVSRKPRDREHPFGHGRAETLATFALALFLLGVGVEVARSGLRRLLNPAPVHAPAWLTASIVLTVLIKAGLAWFSLGLARCTRSKTLEADTWNHLFDIASTLLVVVALVGARYGWGRLDGYAALGVSLFIAWTGVRYVREALSTLLGAAPSPADLAHVRSIAAGVAGVRGAHDVIVHAYGDVRMISLHVEVDADLSVLAAHELAEEVERRIAEHGGAKATVHIDPVDRGHPAYEQAERVLKQFAREHPQMAGFHDLRVSGGAVDFELQADLVVDAAVPREGFPAILADARRRLHERLPGCGRVDLGVETEFATDHEYRRQFAAEDPVGGAGP